MFSLILLYLSITLFVFVLVYGLVFFVLPFVKPIKDSSTNSNIPEEEFNEAVTVLVPCHHEGDSIKSTVKSILNQDYAGNLKIIILFKDEQDSSYEPLCSEYKISAKSKDKTFTIYKTENREIVINCCGKAPKKDKLNNILPTIDTKYTAFLDADHRAVKDWIKSSVAKLYSSTFAGVQSRRAPLSLRKLPQLWDSSQNHIGNELVNIALTRAIGTVFFTGTTCVFLTEKLHGRKFNDCVSEDTYLSYEMIRDGERLGYLPEIGSYEEVAPDIHSYLARRRRWSCGHNKTFRDVVPQILRANLSLRLKLATLIHGLFYSASVAVCVLINLFGLHMFVQYTNRIQILIGLISLILSMGISIYVFGRHKNTLREIIVLFLWIFPQVTLIFPLALYLMEHELYFFLLVFPYTRYLYWIHLLCLSAPAVLTAIGAYRIRLLKFSQLFLVFITYPLFFFLDLWACTLGFSDFIFGRPTWAKIQRTHAEDIYKNEKTSGPSWTIARWGIVICLFAILVVSFNDLTANPNCGEADAYFFEPKLLVTQSPVDWRIKKNAKLTTNSVDTNNLEERLSISFDSKFSTKLPVDAEIAHFIDKDLKELKKGAESLELSYNYSAPLGWESHDYEAVLKTGKYLCKREIPFTTTLKEFKDNKLYINGEEFLVKGIIPSFSPAQKAPSLELGLSQIKEMGANTVRYYHDVRKKVKKEIENQKLLLIDQPDRSTWEDANVGLITSRIGLRNRFYALNDKTRGFKYNLFHTLGNEIEILNPKAHLPPLIDLMKEIIAERPDEIFAYSTYFVFLNLPAAITGINMLDSSSMYWDKGLETIASIGKPFYASEFGGFVAFTEWTPSSLRAYRIFEYWEKLMKAGAFGAVFHQSHDNLSQPVVHGYNDPLSIDQPDDLRGIWNAANEEKEIAKYVGQLFSDFEFEIIPQTINSADKEIRMTFKNRRGYNLKDVLFYENKKNEDVLVFGPVNFLPNEKKEVVLPVSFQLDNKLYLSARYSTHHGLPATSRIVIPLPVKKDTPSVLNEDLESYVTNQQSVEGKLLRSNKLNIVFPTDWKEVSLSNKTYAVEPGRQEFELRAPMEEVINLERSIDGNTWVSAKIDDISNGPQRLRFKLASKYPKEAILLLSGLGTKNFWIRYGAESEWKKLDSHTYRENIIKLDDFQNVNDDYWYLLIPRDNTIFVEKEDHPFGKQIDIPFEMPRVYSPTDFKIEKVS